MSLSSSTFKDVTSKVIDININDNIDGKMNAFFSHWMVILFLVLLTIMGISYCIMICYLQATQNGSQPFSVSRGNTVAQTDKNLRSAIERLTSIVRQH